jgi:hypothetical protein
MTNWKFINPTTLPKVWPIGITSCGHMSFNSWYELINSIIEWSEKTEFDILYYGTELWFKNKEDYMLFIMRWSDEMG